MPTENTSVVPELLAVLAQTASERGGALTKMRLVKFLYLFDLFWAQHSRSGTYTNWPWAFVYYGPYCRQSTDAIDAATKSGYLAAQSYESRYGDADYLLYRPGPRAAEATTADIERRIPISVRSRLLTSVHKWHDDTAGLLDYVYFHTGPMQKAQPRDELSFADEREPDRAQFRPVTMLPLSKKKKEAFRRALQGLKDERHAIPNDTSLFDQEYFSFLEALAQSEPETETGLSGTASLTFGPSTDA